MSTIPPLLLNLTKVLPHKLKKQYNAYLQFWSKKYDEVVNCYCGSLFVGHCTPENLVEHFHEFEKSMNLAPSYLLHLGIDGLSVNKSFDDKLLTELRDQDTQKLNIGSCCLSKVHNAFRNALKQIDCDFDQFAIDIHSFFKLSSARRDNYLSMEEVCVCLKVNFNL